MNNKKTTGLIISILVLLITISTVSATEDTPPLLNDSIDNLTDNSTIIEDMDLSENSTHNHTQLSGTDVVKPATINAPGGTFSQLSSIISGAAAGSTIELTGDYTYNSGFSTNGIGISKNLIINGNGHTIDALSSSVIFSLGKYTFTFHNITFQNARGRAVNGAYYGSVFYSENINGITITHCNFYNNWANRTSSTQGRGGVMYLATCPNFYCYNSTFIDNGCKNYGGVIYNFGSSTTQKLYFVDCTFINNYVGSDAMFHSYSYLYVWNSTMINNTNANLFTTSRYKYVEYSNSVFINNGGTTGSNKVPSGCWWGTNNPNFSAYTGGVVPTTWVVMNFTNSPDFVGTGGSVVLTSSLDWVFNHNTMKYEPLTVGIPARIVNYTASVGTLGKVGDDILGSDSVSYSYPSVSTLTLSATIDDQTLYIKNPLTTGTFTDLQRLIDATSVGGTLSLSKDYFYDPARDLPYTHGMFLNKTITINGNGHNISGIDKARIFQVTGSNVHLHNIVFMNGYAVNKIVNSQFRGGAIYSTGANLNITDCIFHDNYAGQYGGAIDQWSNSVYISGCTFYNNTAGTSYGAVVADSSAYAYIYYSKFIENQAASYGALYLGNGIANYNVFVNNSPTKSVYRNNGNLEYNWWGVNYPTLSSFIQGTVPQTYVIMNFTNLAPITSSGGVVTLLTTLDTIYNTSSTLHSKLNTTLPDRTVIYTTTSPSLDYLSDKIIGNDTNNFTYSSGLTTLLLTSKIDNQVLNISTSDLSVNVTVSDQEPILIEIITYAVTVKNNGFDLAKNVLVNFKAPSGFIYISDTGSGAYNSTTGVWNIGNLANGASKTLTVTVRVPYNYTFVNKTFITPVNVSGTYADFNNGNDNSSVNITVQNLTGGSYTLLQYLIDSTPENGTLNLNFNVTYDPVHDASLIGGMLLNKSITLIGNGYTISGNDTARIFYVTGSNVTLKNVYLVKGYTPNTMFDSNYRGGAIASSSSNLTIINCTFLFNKARTHAGVIQQWGGNIYILNSTFANNSAPRYTVLLIERNGAYAEIFGNLFENNTCSDYCSVFGFMDYAVMNYNAFVNNGGTGSYLGCAYGTVDMEYNWWGNNTPITSNWIDYDLPKTWVIMNFTNTTPITYSSGSSTLRVNLDTVYNSTSGNYQPLTGILPSRNIIYEWTQGNVSPNKTTIIGTNTTTFTYPANMNAWTVNATIDGQTLWIGSSDIGIIIIPSSNPIDDGSNITYTVVVINNGPMNATNINVTLFLPGFGLNIANITNNTGYWNETTGEWYIGNLTAGQNVTLIINGTLCDPGPYLIWNATILNVTDYYDNNFTNNTFISNVTINQISDLEITKNISNPSPAAKDNVTYTITVFNNGPSTAVNITVFDNLSYTLIYINSTATKGYYNETTGEWFLDNLTPYCNETLNITVLVNKSGFTNNFVNVTSNITDNNLTNNVANISFMTPPLSDLWVTINMEPQASNFITFHIQAGNNGIEDANGTIVEFNISNLMLYFNHTLDKGVYNNLTTVWDIGYLEVGEVVNMTLIVELDFPAGLNVTNITTGVNISSWSTDLYPANNSDNVTFEAEIFGNFRLLQRLIDEAPANSIFVLPRSFAYDPVNDAFIDGVDTYDLINGVSIYKNLTIVNPDGYTLGGFGMARIFNISANNVVLDGLRFFEGYSPLGGALNIHADNVQVLRSNFTRNVLWGDYGGAIYVSSRNVLIQDNFFEENSASQLGGAIGAVGARGLQILNNTFINNTVSSNKVFGGAIGLINTTATVNTNVFLDNKATNSYGTGSTIYIENGNVNLEANWYGNNTPNMTVDELIYGNKPETWIVLDWEFVNPNMTGVGLNIVFVLYNSTSGEKTPINYGLPYRNLNVTSRDPTLSWYNTTYTGNNSVNYTYNVAIPVYQINATVDYETITIEFSTLLSLNKTLLNDTVWFGDNLIYNITIVNYGPHNTLVINLTDLLPSGLTVNNIKHSVGSTSLIGDAVFWALNVPAGTIATLLVNTTPTVEGNYTNNVSLNASTPLDYFIGGTNRTATGYVLYLSDLEVNLTVSSPHFYVGEDIVYNVRVANYGPSTAYNITVNMPVSNGLIYLYQDWPGTYSQATGLWNISSLNPGDILDINITFRINRSGWYNQTINVTSDSVDNITWNNNKTLSFNVTTQVDLVLTMSINKGEALYGDNGVYITYTVLNCGPSPAENVTIFTYYTGLDYIGKSSGFGSFVNDTPTAGRWLVGTLNANTTRTITLRFAANTLGNFTITGRANSSNNDSKWSDNYANVTINVIKSVDLSITKTVSTTTPYIGQIINYTITVRNNAGFDVENVTVTDILDYRLIYDNNNPLYNGTEWFVGNLTVGESKNITFNVTVNSTGTIWNNVTVKGSLNDSNPGNNHAEISILSDYKYADLSITKTVNNTNPFLEENITYTITVRNNGGYDTENVTVYDPLPSVLVYDGNNPLFNGMEWFVGNLTVGQSKSLSFIVTVDGIGRIWNNATVNSSLRDKNPGNNNASVYIDVPVADDLRIYLNVIPNPPQANNPFIINVTVWNRGFEDNNNVKVDFLLPSSLSYINSTCMGSYNPVTGVWDIGFLPNGARVNLEIWVYPNVIGNVTITGNVSGSVADVAPWNNRANLTFEIIPAFDLTITKTANNYSIYDGDTISFNISVWNNGPFVANNVKITDYLPYGVTYLFDNSSGVYYSGNNTVDWTFPSLNVGENITINLIAKVWGPGFSFNNRAVVSAYGTDNNISDNTAYSGIVNVTQVNDLEVRLNASKTVDVGIGEVISFYVTVINHGPSNASGVIADFLLPSDWTYVTDNGGGFYNPSNGTWYIGSLARGNSITLTVRANLTNRGIYNFNATVNGSYYDNDTSNNIAFLNISSMNVFDLNITAYWNMTNNTLVWSDIGEYTVIVSNKGPDNATNVTVTLYVPGVTYVNHTGAGSLNTTTLVWDVGNLSVGEYKNITIRFNASILGFYITRGNITGYGYDNNTLDNNYTLNLSIVPLVDLVMTNITVNTTLTCLDSLLEFNITVFNRGPCNATNTTIVGFLPLGWSIVGGTTVGNVPYNKSEVFTVIVNATSCGNFSVGFNATINGRDTYPLDNNLTFSTITVVYACDLMITIKVSDEYPTTGDIIVYVVTVTNLDWRTAHNVAANVTIPTDLIFDHYYLASGTYNPGNGTWTIGNMSYRNSTSLFLFVRVNSPGNTSFWVNVTGDDYDFHIWNNNDTVNITAGVGLDLNITIAVDNSTPYTGDNITFLVSVENIGLTSADNVNVDINIPNGFINPRSDDLNFTGASYYVGTLNSGATKTFNFTVTVLTKNNSTFTVGVGASKWDYNVSNNVANVTISPVGASDLIVTITSNVSHIRVGENITYTVKVLNNGTVDVDNVVVFNNLPSSIVYSASTPFYIPGSGMWIITNLSAGASETLNITITHTSAGVFNYTANCTGDIIDTNPSNNLDNITIIVDEYTDLVTFFTVDNLTVIDGGLLNFTITVFNNGSFNLSDVKVRTNLPCTNIYNSTGIFDTSLGVWNVGNLSSFENRTITLTVNMTNPNNYTYWANSTCLETERDYTNNNQSLNITIYADYDLVVNITLLSNSTLNVGENVSFLITVVNYGPSTAYNVNITDNIYGTPITISKGVYTGNVWNVGNLTVNEIATLVLTLNLTSNGTFNYNVTGVADILSQDHNLTNNIDNVTVAVINAVDLIITITCNASVVENGDIVEFTVTVLNNASSTAHSVLVDTEGLFNGTVLGTSYGVGFLSSVSWFIPTLSPYAIVTLNVTKRLNKNNLILVNVSSNDVELDNASNNDSLLVKVNGLADLEVIITTNTTNVYVTENITFKILVINHGPDTAENVTVYLDLPYSTNFTDTYMYDSKQGVWFIGTLENNTNTTLNVTVNLRETGIWVFNASVNSTTRDNYTVNNFDNVTINVSSLVDLEINITINNSGTLYPGDLINILVCVTNNGPSNATSVNVTYNLPGTVFIPSKGLILFGGFWSVGTLNVSETAYLNITHILTVSDMGVYTSTVYGVEHENNYTNNNATLNLTLNQSADLEISISSNATILDLNEPVLYIITVKNNGPNSVTNPNIQIDLPDNLNINLNMSTNGIFNGTHWIISTLNAGGSGVSYLYIYGSYNMSGNKTLQAKINSTIYDKNTTNNYANNTVLVNPSVDLSVNFTGNTFFNPDGSITVNITVWNNGPVNATNVTLYTNIPNTNDYNYTKGYFDTVQNIWYIYDLDVGESETLILNITLENETFFFANVTNNIPDWNTSNNIAYLNITTPRITDVSINITVNNTHPGLGESITFTVTVTNFGPYTASDVMVMVDLPASPIYTLDKGIFDTVLGNWSIGNLSKNETVTLNITINATNTTIYHANVTTTINDTNLTNNNATVTFNLSATSDLSISLGVNQTSFTIGDNITLTVNLTNYGPDLAENITIKLNLPSGFILDSTYNTTINITSLTSDSSLEFNLTGILTSNGTYSFEVNVSSSTYDNDTSNNQDTITIYASSIVDLSVIITSNTTNILSGEYIELLINVTNHGPGIAENVTLSSNIFNATSLKDTGYYDKDTGYWYIGTLNTNETKILNLTLQTFKNTTYLVNVSTLSIDNNTSNNYDNITINVTPIANLNITVSVSNIQPVNNSEITYIISVTNNGYNLAENVIMSCNLTIFNFTTSNNTNYNETTGIWNIGNLNAGETVILEVKYKINTTGNITNTFTVNTTTLETDTTDNTLNITLEILNSTTPVVFDMVDLVINITVNNSLPKVNETIEFNITVFNNASINATNITILSILPTGLTPISGFMGTWNITNLTAYNNISVSFTVNVTSYGSFVVNASADCNEWDRDPVNNRANQLIIIKENNGNYTDLLITVTCDSNLTYGELFTYNITVTNNGTTDANDVNATIGLFNGLKVYNSSTTDYNETLAHWNVGNLTSGTSKTLTLTVNITEYGQYTNVFVVWSDNADKNSQNNLLIDSFEIEDNNLDINIKITANKTYGNKNDTMLFTVTVTNPSTKNATNVNVTLNIPTGLEIVNFTGYNNGSYYIGELNSSEIYTFNFTAKINSTNTLTVTVNVTINETETNTLNNIDNITITPINSGYNGVADLTVNITTSLLNLTTSNMELNQYPEYGDVPYFTIYVTNHGPDEATNVKVPLTVPAGCSIMAQDAYWDNTTESFIISNISVNNTVKFEVSMLIETTDVLLINTTATSDQFDPNITDNTATISMYPFIPEPKCDLNVTVRVIGNEFFANSTVTFNITLRNDGQDIAYNVTVRNTIPTGLIFHNITTYDAYTLNGDGWDIPQILPGASMQFLVTYNITKKGLYQTTVNTNSSIQDTDPISNGMGVAFYAGEAEPPRREVKTKVATPTVTTTGGKVKLNGGSWTFTGKLQLANNTASPSSYSNFEGQTLYANVTGPDAITRTYTADTVTGADGKTTFTVPNSDILAGENKYTILIWYKGEKTDGEHYLPSSNSKTNIKVIP